MKKTIIVVVFLFEFISAVAAAGNDDTQYGTIEVERNDSLKYGPSISSSLRFYESDHSPNVSIDLIRSYYERDGDSYFFISLYYSGDDWLFLDELIVSTDSHLYELKDEDPSHDVRTGYVSEHLFFVIEYGMILDMADSRQVRIQFHGEPLTLSDEQRGRIKHFASKMMFLEK